jgi:succinyl-diaminopimelate desuccinylase
VEVDNPEQVFRLIDGYRDEAIRLQGELTSRVALGPANGGTGEHDKAAFLMEELRRLGPDSLEEIRAPQEGAAGGYRPNLVARWGGPAAGPAVWVLSHMDVVPAGDPASWRGDPYEVLVEGDRIYGRGVEDDQHGIVSSLLAVKALRESGAAFGRPLGLAMVADEETGSRYGLSYLLGHVKGLFSPEDLIVVPDAGNEQGTMIEVAEKSVLWIRFTVIGKQCHASTPQKGRNSLYGAARLITELGGLEERFNAVDPLFHPPASTFAPTKMEADVSNVNTVPGRDVFHMDCRLLPVYGPGEVVEAVRGMAAETASELGLRVDVEVVQMEEAAEPTPVDAPVVEALRRSVKRVTGREAEPAGIGGGTVAALFRKAGLPAAVWMTAQDTAHQADEYCLLSDVLSDAKVFACLFAEPPAPRVF